MRSFLRAVLIAAAAICVAGCATVTTAGGERLAIGSDAFREYVEAVFRQQNRTATRLAFALDAADPAEAGYEALAAAEENLLAACTDLNALAASRRDGDASSRQRQLRAAREAPRCEEATLRAERLVPDVT